MKELFAIVKPEEAIGTKPAQVQPEDRCRLLAAFESKRQEEAEWRREAFATARIDVGSTRTRKTLVGGEKHFSQARLYDLKPVTIKELVVPHVHACKLCSRETPEKLGSDDKSPFLQSDSTSAASVVSDRH